MKYRLLSRYHHTKASVVEAMITNGFKSNLDNVQINLVFSILIPARFSPLFVNTTDLEVIVPSGEVVWWWLIAIGRILVEVVSVDWRLHYRCNRRLQRTLRQALPVETIEPPEKCKKRQISDSKIKCFKYVMQAT